MGIFSIFKKQQKFNAVCLSLPTRNDRWELAEREFEKIGYEVERFFAVPHQNKFRSFNLSQKAILESIKSDTIVFEDDVLFQNLHLFDEVLKSAPDDWEMLYLGGNVRSELHDKANKYWWRCYDTWTTHAIIYRASVIPKILERFNVEGYNYDEQLRVDILYNVKAYICKPFLAIQRPDYSDLCNQKTDYTELFKTAETNLI